MTWAKPGSRPGNRTSANLCGFIASTTARAPDRPGVAPRAMEPVPPSPPGIRSIHIPGLPPASSGSRIGTTGRQSRPASETDIPGSRPASRIARRSRSGRDRSPRRPARRGTRGRGSRDGPRPVPGRSEGHESRFAFHQDQSRPSNDHFAPPGRDRWLRITIDRFWAEADQGRPGVTERGGSRRPGPRPIACLASSKERAATPPPGDRRETSAQRCDWSASRPRAR